MARRLNIYALALPVIAGLLMLFVAAALSLWLGAQPWMLLLPAGGVLVGHFMGEAMNKN